MKCEYQIIDNVLPNSVSDKIANDFLVGARFSWFYNDNVVTSSPKNNLNNYQFTHTFYNEYVVRSELMSVVVPILEYLRPESIIRIKANLNPRTDVRHTFDYHVDYESKASDRKTAIYYVNTNNGVTILEDGTEIKSIANRLLIFNQNTRHTGTTCTDEKVRCLINFNYIEYCND
jgi:hypothetical protein